MLQEWAWTYHLNQEGREQGSFHYLFLVVYKMYSLQKAKVNQLS